MRYDGWLERWREAGLLDDSTLERIREFELARSTGLGWPVRVLIAFGGVAIGAGVLLFVAAHWDTLPPLARFSLVQGLVAVFHIAGVAARGRFDALATTSHAVGTAAFGAGIFLAAQIFNLAEHWPAGLMLWAAGAWAGWWLLRDWPHAVWTATLTPLWLAGEWIEIADRGPHAGLVVAGGLALFSLAYLSVRAIPVRRDWHVAVGNLGALAILPPAVAFVGLADYSQFRPVEPEAAAWLGPLGWVVMLAVPIGAGYLLNRNALRPMLTGGLWVIAMIWVADLGVLPYLWCTAGALAMVGWGLAEARRERINIGVAGFALTVVVFYFSSVADKLDRAFSLLVLGVLLLVGGWALERARRRLLARIGGYPR